MKNVSKGTIIRTLVLFLALLNQFLVMFGVEKLPIDETMIEVMVTSIYETVSYVLALIVTVVAWWKNNSYTEAAQEGDRVMKLIKNGNKKHPN